MGALHELFEHTPEAIFGIDENRKIRFWNKSCENLLKVSHQQAIGKSCAELFCGKDSQGSGICSIECPIINASNVRVFDGHFSLVLHDSDNRPIEVTVGSYYINKSSRKNNDDIQAFHSLRPVFKHKRHAH